MSDKTKAQHTTEKDTLNAKENNDDRTISIKKSTYNKMLKGIIAAIAVATFFGGYSLGSINDSGSV